MANEWSSVPGYGETDLNQLQQAAGITQFSGANGWYQLINGILVQGGIVNVGAGATATFPFQVAITSQLLGVFLQAQNAAAGSGYGSIDIATTNLQQFTIVNTGVAKDFFWLAIGV